MTVSEVMYTVEAYDESNDRWYPVLETDHLADAFRYADKLSAAARILRREEPHHV